MTGTGVRCTMLRGGTSRGLYFEAADLPSDPAARDDLLLRLMGTPDPRQIDGLGGRVEYAGDVAISGVPGTAAPVLLDFAAAKELLPTGRVRDVIDGIDVTCVDNGMPVVLVAAEAFGRTGGESPDELASPDITSRIDAFRRRAGRLMRLPEEGSIPKTVLIAPPRDGGHVCTRSFIPVQPHSAIGVLAAITAVTGMLLPGAVGHELTAGWTSRVDVEHPTGHLLVDVLVDPAADPPRVIRSGVVRTARKLFDGLAFPRA